MFKKSLLPALALGLVLSTSGGLARAQSPDDMSFSGMVKTDRMLAKQNTMTKAEFMAMAEKAWDMKAKEMKVTGDKMTEAQYMAFVQFLSRGEKNK